MRVSVAARALPLVLVVAAVSALVPFAAEPSPLPRGALIVRSDARVANGLLVRMNQVRRRHGLVALRVSQALGDAAYAHSDEMGRDGYFGHASEDGTAFSARVGRWYGSSTCTRWRVGENLLWASPDTDPRTAIGLWMDSPPHRANILDPAWREVGVSALHFGWAGGSYGGLPATIVTADFGGCR
jgi:uncharacterized protein YkwD